MVGGRRLVCGAEKVEAERQQNGPLAIGEKAKVPNADEAAWQSVEQKPPQELVHGQAHQPFLVLVSGVPPAKGDCAVAEGHQPMIGDGDAVSIGTEIPDHVFRSSKRTLAIDHPVVPEELPEPGGERLGMS